MADADVTRRALTLDFASRDTTTKWAKKTYSESTIKGSFDPAAMRFLAASGLNVPLLSSPFYTGNYVRRGDRIKNVASTEFTLSTVKELWRLNEFVGYVCQADRILKPADRAATSGTWHADNDSVNTDARLRTMTWLDTYVAFTAGDYEVVFSGQDYPPEYDLVEDNLDVLVTVEYIGATPVYDYQHVIYKFEENVALHCYAFDTSTLTAANLLESFEEAVREANTNHPTTTYLGNIREITATKPAVHDAGMMLWENTINIRYTRQNSDYAGSSVTVTWGPSTSASGTFTLPNVVYMSPPVKVNNTRLMPPGRMGNVLQKLGMPDYMVTIRCDLDVCPSGLTWKRPQTTTPKTDVVDWQVFLDIAFNGQYAGTQVYQTLNLGWGGTIQATLEEVTPVETADGRELELVFYCYNSVSQTAYKTMFGISP